MEYAISICDNLSNNFRILFNVQPQEIQDAEILLEWLKDATKHQDYNNRSIKKNILKFGPASLRKSEILNRALDVLYHDGWIYFFKGYKNTHYVTLTAYQRLV